MLRRGQSSCARPGVTVAARTPLHELKRSDRSLGPTVELVRRKPSCASSDPASLDELVLFMPRHGTRAAVGQGPLRSKSPVTHALRRDNARLYHRVVPQCGRPTLSKRAQLHFRFWLLSRFPHRLPLSRAPATFNRPCVSAPLPLQPVKNLGVTTPYQTRPHTYTKAATLRSKHIALPLPLVVPSQLPPPALKSKCI